MKKKHLFAGVGLFVAMTVFVTTAFASINNTSGYERFKNASLNTQGTKNATSSVMLKISDNGETVYDMAADVKMDGVERINGVIRMSGAGKSEQMRLISQNGRFLTQMPDSDVYLETKMNGLNTNMMDFGVSKNQRRFVELLMDTFIGDLKSYFISDGDKITISLEGSQIPELIQLGASVLSESLGKLPHEATAKGTELQSDIELPVLVENVIIRSINAETTVAENETITEISGSFIISGLDKDGESHTLSIDFLSAVSDVGTTVVEPVSLDGARILEIGSPEYDQFIKSLH